MDPIEPSNGEAECFLRLAPVSVVRSVKDHRRIVRKWVSIGFRWLALVGVGTKVILNRWAAAIAAGVVWVERLSWIR